MDFGTITPVSLDDDAKAAYCHELVGIKDQLAEYAEEVYGDSSVKRLRYDVTNGNLKVPSDISTAMQRFCELESIMISAYVKEVATLVTSFYFSYHERFNQLDEADYLQHACIAICNSCATYDGSTMFSTYAYHAAKRELIGFVRSQEPFSGIGRDIRKIRTSIKMLMADEGIDFEQALSKISEQEELTEEDVWDVRASGYRTRPLTENDFLLEEESNSLEIDVELVQLALQEANLSDLERELVVAHMNGDHTLRTRIIKTRINPNTGNPYNRANLNQAFQRGCNKIKLVYERYLARVAA